MIKKLPSIERLWEEFYVDSSSPSGLRNAVDRGKCGNSKGKHSGYLGANGYWLVKINSKPYPCHRIVQALKCGSDSELSCDHIDRNRSNNHPFNLRWLNLSGQQLNKTRHRPNKTGFLGVSKRRGGWEYVITRKDLGRIRKSGFSTPLEAYEARQARLKELNQCPS